MTAQQQRESRDVLARAESMSPEAVAAMERRLLEAFAAHHRSAGRAWRQWIAAAAALALLAGAFAGWRGLSGGWSAPRPGSVRAPEPASATGGQPTGRTESAGNAPGRNVAIEVPATAPARAAAARARRRPAPRFEAEPAAFVPLPGAAGLPRFESGSIVRVDLPLSSLAAYGVDISSAGGAGPVPTDVLVGQDGEARAIRLVGSSPLSTSRSKQ